jgi:hypothetical protein
MPAVKIFESLDLDPIALFLDGHEICAGGCDAVNGRKDK